MPQASARRLGALILGVALALPLAVVAQAPGASPAPPTTAPTGKVPDNPARGMKPSQEVSTAKGSTAVPGWNHPPESWKSASETPQYASIPGRETNRLIQSAGREWRAFHNGPLTQYGGWLLVLTLAGILLFYLIKGSFKLHGPPTGRLIERFNAVERVSHWTTAISFVFLALSGMTILWGKYLVLPWLGAKGFSWLLIVAKNVHNFVGPLFIFAIVVMFLIYVKDNIPQGRDIKWLTSFGKEPSGRFNAGEKAWFWGGVILLSAFVAWSGLVLLFPNFDQTRAVMQDAWSVHAIAALIYIAISLGHIYMGTIGVEGSYRAMREGVVDESWAREHHEIWYQEVKSGKREAAGGAVPAGAPHMEEK